MGKDYSQFTTLNHVHTGQNKTMTTNCHKDASFVEFREHTFEGIRKGSMPIADTVVCISIFFCFMKTITLIIECQQRVDGVDEGKTHLMGSAWHLNTINLIHRKEIVTLE